MPSVFSKPEPTNTVQNSTSLADTAKGGRSIILLPVIATLCLLMTACANLTSTSLSTTSPTDVPTNSSKVTVVVDKYGCQATPSQVSQGKVEFTLTNATDSVTNIRIAAPKDGQWTNTVADSTYLRPHKSAQATTTLEPGPYAVLCAREGSDHMSRITVV